MYELLRKALCICILLHFGLVGAVVKHGIIGMGINMYKPFCCNACTDSLSPLFLNCTVIENGIGTTSPACRASNEPWLHTLADCFVQKCTIDDLSNSEIQACWNQLSHANSSSYAEWVPTTSPTTEVAADAVFLNSTSLVNAARYRNLRLSYQEWEYEEDMHSRFALVVSLLARFLRPELTPCVAMQRGHPCYPGDFLQLRWHLKDDQQTWQEWLHVAVDIPQSVPVLYSPCPLQVQTFITTTLRCVLETRCPRPADTSQILDTFLHDRCPFSYSSTPASTSFSPCCPSATRGTSSTPL